MQHITLQQGEILLPSEMRKTFKYMAPLANDTSNDFYKTVIHEHATEGSYDNFTSH